MVTMAETGCVAADTVVEEESGLTRFLDDENEASESKKNEKLEKSHAAMEKSNEYYELSSIADRAKMVEQYNNKKNRKK